MDPEDHCWEQMMGPEGHCLELRWNREGHCLERELHLMVLNAGLSAANPVEALHTIVGDDILDPDTHTAASSVPADIDAVPQYLW